MASKATYVETSAILCYLLSEESATRVVSQINDATTVVTSALTLLEVERTILRCEMEGRLNPVQVQNAKRIFQSIVSSWIVLEMTPRIRERAAAKFPIEPIRSLDAIHLATALEFLRAFEEVFIVSLDKRILENLKPLGFAAA